MSVDYVSIIATLQQLNPSIAGVIITSMTGDIIYCTSNWQPNPQEVKNVINAWRGGNSISVTLQGVKFSVLQSVQDRFISTNIKKQGHLVGATTPGGQCLLGFVLPDAAYDGAYMDVARAAGQIRPGGSTAGLAMTAATQDVAFQKTDVSGVQLQSSGVPKGAQAAQGGMAAGGGSPEAQEVAQLLQWVRDPNGLAQFIQYCLTNYDQARVAAFARFYRTLRQILG
nr:profilin family protein [Candidatus Sigynarchaeota archaeon]